MGGPDGIDNRQAIQLGKRTLWLKQEVEKRAPSSSPVFTGTPTAPTPSPSSNDTQIATTEFVTLALAKMATETDFINLKNLLVGIPFPYPLASVPTGCLAFNGQAFSKSLYPELAKKYPSGVLPDLRGEFIRGWDNGRRVDTGRALLSSQGDAIRNISGTFGNGGSDQYGIFFKGSQSGAFVNNSSDNNAWIPNTASSTSNLDRCYSVKFDASRQVPTANENRPRNIAFQYICIAA